MRAPVIVLAVCMSVPAAAKPGAIAVPPVAVDIGAGTPLGDAVEAVPSTELRVGASWASLYWKPTSVDFAIGYIGSYRTLAPGSDGVIARTTMTEEPVTFRLHGAYAQLDHAIENHRHWRTWLGGRIETMTGDYRGQTIGAIGAALRLGAEIYSAGAGGVSDHNTAAVFAGSIALGIYVEGTARTLPQELGPVGVGAGVSVRIPFLAAVGG